MPVTSSYPQRLKEKFFLVTLLGQFHRAKMPLLLRCPGLQQQSPIRKREFLCTGKRALWNAFFERAARTSTSRSSVLISRPIASRGKFTYKTLQVRRRGIPGANPTICKNNVPGKSSVMSARSRLMVS